MIRRIFFLLLIFLTYFNFTKASDEYYGSLRDDILVHVSIDDHVYLITTSRSSIKEGNCEGWQLYGSYVKRGDTLYMYDSIYKFHFVCCAHDSTIRFIKCFPFLKECVPIFLVSMPNWSISNQAVKAKKYWKERERVLKYKFNDHLFEPVNDSILDIALKSFSIKNDECKYYDIYLCRKNLSGNDCGKITIHLKNDGRYIYKYNGEVVLQGRYCINDKFIKLHDENLRFDAYLNLHPNGDITPLSLPIAYINNDVLCIYKNKGD